jgi:hypothetical protein
VTLGIYLPCRLQGPPVGRQVFLRTGWVNVGGHLRGGPGKHNTGSHADRAAEIAV